MLTPHDAAAGGTALGAALRFAAVLWVGSHQVPLVSDGLTISLLPWLLALWPVAIVVRATRRVAAVVGLTGLRDALAIATLVGVTHAGWTVAIAALAGTPALTVRPGQAVLHAFAVAAVSAAGALLIRTDLGRQLRDRLPTPVLLGVRLGLIASAVVTAMATLLVLAAVIVRWNDLTTVITSLGGDLPARAALTLVTTLFLGTAVGWVTAGLVGSTVTVAGTPWGPFVAGLGHPVLLDPAPALPALPTFALLPERLPAWAGYAPLTWWLTLALVTAVLLHRSRSWSAAHRVGAASVLVVTVTLAMALLAALSSGAWGQAALAHLGPDVLDVMRVVGAAASATAVVVLGTPPLVQWTLASLRQRRHSPEV